MKIRPQPPDVPGAMPFAGSYFDGHFAMTPPGTTENPSGPRVPFRTTSDPCLKVSGTIPVYPSLHDLALAFDSKPIFEGVGPAFDRLVYDKAMELHALALPGRRLGHNLIHVLVVFGAFAQRRVHETAKRQRDGRDCCTNLCGFGSHKKRHQGPSCSECGDALRISRDPASLSIR